MRPSYNSPKSTVVLSGNSFGAKADGAGRAAVPVPGTEW